MTMTDTGVKPIPVYTPPADGKPRNAVDAKWMKLHRAMLHYMERRAAKKSEPIDDAEYRDGSRDVR